MNKSFVYEYLNKRDTALSRDKQAILATEIFELKKRAMANLREMIESAKYNLEKNGAEVYVVKDGKAAAEKIKELTAAAKILVKSKSNFLDNLNIKDSLGDRLTETDLGAYIVSQIGGDSDHPVLPAIDLTAEEIAAGFKKKFNREYPTEAKALVDVLKREIKEKILVADVGLTGANAVTADGQIMLLENEGNISLITRLPETHIAVCGVEKIVATPEEAVKVAKAAAVWGTGQSWPSYVSFIGGPSKTADIENELVQGVQGAQRLVLILVEGETYNLLGTELESMLYCIHCGACYDLCPTWNCSGQMPKVRSEETIFNCTLCQNCTFNCPAKIDWQNIARIRRSQFTDQNLNTEHNLKMIENVRQHGNPFGDIGDGPPAELFCC
ncbi:MAG: LUD domain-containing protein [Candidatus Buchananbacteria bacterium]|jgi:L-lactate dehydrogenase complex protein LldG